jgi:D-alanyl-D-alanine carboxypeptidase (penicillin-binding protein 5/6)
MPPKTFALILALSLGSAAASAAPRPAYRGAIVVDVATNQTLFAENADEVSPPASMTKLMTFAVLDDRIRSGEFSLQTPITITPDDAREAQLRDSTNVALKAREVFPVEELIYAMMIQSANDAAYAVAEAVGRGSVPAFVGMMNAKARSLGMTRTVFRTPNGLPVRSHRIADGDLTTPRDFSVLCRYLLLHTDILKYTSVRQRYFGEGRRMPAFPMTNHNHLLGKIAGVDGLKTGFTFGAGYCLAATAQRGGRRILVVLMDSPDTRSRDLKVAELIERGFDTLPTVIPRIVPAGALSSPTRPSSDVPPIEFSIPR